MITSHILFRKTAFLPPVPDGCVALSWGEGTNGFILKSSDGLEVAIGDGLNSISSYADVVALPGYPGTSSGGNGEGDRGKMVVFDYYGVLTSSDKLEIKASDSVNYYASLESTPSGFTFIKRFNGQTNGTLAITLPYISSGTDFSVTFPAGSGTIALREDFNSLVLPGPFNDDSAAATGQVPIDAAYRKSDGSVAWRQT